MQGLLSRIAVGVFSLLIIAMVLLALFDDRGALALRERREQRDALQSDVNEATTKNEELQEEIRKLREDPEEIERRAREHLNLVRPDAGVKNLLVTFNNKTGYIIRVSYEDAVNNHIELDFSETKVPAHLDEGLFTFTPPKGVKVITGP